MTPPAVGSGTEALSQRGHVTYRRFRIEIVDGPDQGGVVESDSAELGVGTSPGNALVLTDPAVSRHHLSIAATPGGFVLRDLDSTNGTQVAGRRVEAIYLQAGDRVELGRTALRFEPLVDEVREQVSKDDRFGRMLGCSPAMRRIFATIPRIAGSASTVLVEGETGTGKGLVAEAIHEASPRAGWPFVVVDCSAIPYTLIESELFGHERGAFTSAHAARVGAFEAARGGTLFLDEIGELPLDMQPKLLRALEERVVKRIGSQVPIRLDVRVIAATNRDLRKEVNRSQFRSDLYYRLNVVRLRIPPLRERRDDIPFLVAHFYQQLARGEAAPPAELVEVLANGEWPGNVRELRSAVERAVLLDDPELLREAAEESGADAAEPGADTVDLGVPYRLAKEHLVAEWERRYLQALIRKAGGNLTEAGRIARTDRNYLRELLHKHKIALREV